MKRALLFVLALIALLSATVVPIAVAYEGPPDGEDPWQDPCYACQHVQLGCDECYRMMFWNDWDCHPGDPGCY